MKMNEAKTGPNRKADPKRELIMNPQYCPPSPRPLRLPNWDPWSVRIAAGVKVVIRYSWLGVSAVRDHLSQGVSAFHHQHGEITAPSNFKRNSGGGCTPGSAVFKAISSR